jgi:dual specificity tyrosine-phosphorylation-regulated kinase 2/3/4
MWASSMYIQVFSTDVKHLYILFSDALKYYGNRLTDYERIEMEVYPEIWYLGLDACKIHGDPHNGEFDDDNGSYNKVSNIQIIEQYTQGL